MTPLRVLLVEDNPADANLVYEAFLDHEAPIELSTVNDGTQATDRLAAAVNGTGPPPPDLIILDLNIPGINGHQVLANLRADHRLSVIPTVILTSSDSEADVLRCYHQGANCYLTKPIDMSRYLETVRAIREFWLSLASLPTGRTPRDGWAS